MLYTNYFIDIIKNFHPERALLFEDSKIIHAGELLITSQQLATALIKKGIKKGDRIVLAVKPGTEFLQLIYANMMIRTVISIIDPEMGRDNYLAKLKQFDPQHAFVDSRLVLLSEHPIVSFILLKLNKSIPSFPILKHCQIFTTGSWLPIAQKHSPIKKLFSQKIVNTDFNYSDDSDDFLVTYTSGTLAEPKGVVHSYSSLSNSIRYLSDMIMRNEDTAIATHLPQFALLGVNANVKVYLWDNHLTAEQKITFINKNNITALFGPPSDYLPMIQYLNKRAEKFPGCLKNIYLGSAPVYGAFLSRLLTCCNQVKVTCLYGMTENLMITFQEARAKVNEVIKGDLVGSPFPNVKLHIESDGEICITSDQMFDRYWQAEKHSGFHRTGDIGKIDEHGRLILLGRKKNMIIRRNFNVYPGLYEPTINNIDGVIETVMIGIYNQEKADEEIILVVESELPMKADFVWTKLQEGTYSIDKEALPDKIVFMTLPRSGRQNKVDRKVLANNIKKVLS